MPKYKLHLSVTAIHELYDHEIEADSQEEAEKVAVDWDKNGLGPYDFTNDRADYVYESLKVDECEAREERS